MRARIYDSNMARNHAMRLRNNNFPPRNKIDLLRQIVSGKITYQAEALPVLEKDLRALCKSSNRDIANLARQAVEKLFPEAHQPIQNVAELLADCFRLANQLVEQRDKIRLAFGQSGFELELEAFSRQVDQVIEQHARLSELASSLAVLLLDRKIDGQYYQGRLAGIPEQDVARREPILRRISENDHEIAKMGKEVDKALTELQLLDQGNHSLIRQGRELQDKISKASEDIGAKVEKEEQGLAANIETLTDQLARLELITAPEPNLGVTPEAIALRDGVRTSGKQLLFTRNVDLQELEDIVKTSELRTENGWGVKYFRYGLGHEYGQTGEVVTIVMKSEFWANERDRSRLGNLFLREVDGMGVGHDTIMADFEALDGKATHDDLLNKLAQKFDYNRLLEVRPADDPVRQFDLKNDIDQIGMTVLGPAETFQGYYPQLEVSQNVQLNQVACILVPEHLWPRVERTVSGNPELAALLRRIDGTGRTETDFLEGREKMARRTRFFSGNYYPSFGFNSFHIFEQEFLRLVLEAKTQQNMIDFEAQAKEVMARYGYVGLQYNGWIWAEIENGSRMSRKENDWKIFVNPRQEIFFPVLDAVTDVLAQHPDLGIKFKVPPDMSTEWRPGRPFSTSNTPKITIYMNQASLRPILTALDLEFDRLQLNNAGFGNQPGPSFARNYGGSDLLFYKFEHFVGGREERVSIAQQAEAEAMAEGITDPQQLLERKQAALRAAGYIGENFYRKPEDVDPML